jgi:hypothetical protein
MQHDAFLFHAVTTIPYFFSILLVSFTSDGENRTAWCPQGATSVSWVEGYNAQGHDIVQILFERNPAQPALTGHHTRAMPSGRGAKPFPGRARDGSTAGPLYRTDKNAPTASDDGGSVEHRMRRH